jgi:hypothetical protein
MLTNTIANKPKTCDAMNPPKKLLMSPIAIPSIRATFSYSIINGVDDDNWRSAEMYKSID